MTTADELGWPAISASVATSMETLEQRRAAGTQYWEPDSSLLVCGDRFY